MYRYRHIELEHKITTRMATGREMKYKPSHQSNFRQNGFGYFYPFLLSCLFYHNDARGNRILRFNNMTIVHEYAILKDVQKVWNIALYHSLTLYCESKLLCIYVTRIKLNVYTYYYDPEQEENNRIKNLQKKTIMSETHMLNSLCTYNLHSCITIYCVAKTLL